MFARPPVRWKNFLLSLAISWTLSDLFLMNSQDIIFFLDIFSWILFLSASLLISLSCDTQVPFSSHLRSWRTTSCWPCEISRSRSKGPNQEDGQMEGACKFIHTTHYCTLIFKDDSWCWIVYIYICWYIIYIYISIIWYVWYLIYYICLYMYMTEYSILHMCMLGKYIVYHMLDISHNILHIINYI